jgi:hypothetical protein
MPKKAICYAILKKGPNKGKFCYEGNKYCKNPFHRGYKVKLKYSCDVCGIEFKSKLKYDMHFKDMTCVPKDICIICNNKDKIIEAYKKTINDLKKKIDSLELPPKSKENDLRNILLNFLDNN